MRLSGSQASSYVDVLWHLLSQSHGSKTTPSRLEMRGQPTNDQAIVKPAPPIPVTERSPPFFALIIGINRYKSLGVTSLRGAVADADSITQYLENSLKVGKSRIRNIRNAEATRAAIISAFIALENHPEIGLGDPILIYYAGHGASVKPPIGWEAGGASRIQMLIPHDYHTDGVQGIPDRTISVLLTRLAKAKGDNITVIFDCCHSGSGTRKDSTDPTHLIRGFEITEPVPAKLDENIWSNPGQRGSTIPSGFLQTGLRSHVLLAACGAEETAKEQKGRGAFTKALLDALNAVSVDTISYADLLQRMHAIPEQNPQCEGVHQRRILFNAKAPSTGRVFYKVHQEEDKYKMDAGAAHGINTGAEFAVYEDCESPPKKSPLGTLIVKEIDAFTTALVHHPGNIPAFVLTGVGYALQTKAGEEEDLRLHVALDDKLTPVFEALAQEMLRTGSDRRRILLVEKDKAELDISIEGGRAVFNILNPQVTQYGLKQLPYSIEPTYDDVYPVIRASAHYHWHLRRNNKSKVLQNHIQFEFRQVEELEEYDDDFNAIIKPVGDNLNVEGVVDMVVHPDNMYGIKLINDSDLDLYPSLFFFDHSDLSISSYYQPPTSAQRLDVPLPGKKDDAPGSLSIGYGSGGSPPFCFYVRDGQDVDVGFLKLFLTTEPVDYSNIPQTTPFDFNHRGGGSYKSKYSLIWDTILVAVVQRRAPLIA